MAVTGDEFRAALAHWASGVAIVTSAHGDRIHGMTVSAFSSVSLDPPLVLVCADKTSHTLGVIEAGGVFAANILSAGQQGLSNRFASKRDEDRRFEGLAWRRGVTGAPILPGALAVLDCRVVACHDAGDHVIYVGRVEGAEVMDGEPLLYYGGGYRGMRPPEAG
jgi:flavin reductase (DIM6/NTAB) family NADH-FMN oxidoreductase RutF